MEGSPMLEIEADRPQLRVLLDHFALLEDDRESWRVAHPLPEVLLLLVCGTIAACDDFDEIVEWGEDSLAFLRRFLPYHHGIPTSRWLRMLVNRIDPDLFSDIFLDWVAQIRPDAPDLVALDGKTSRGSHDRGRGRSPLHLVSAFATRERLVIGQEDATGRGEQETIPLLLERLAAKGRLKGSLVTIDAVACNGRTAQAILDTGADYLLAVKANQPGLMGEIAAHFADPAAHTTPFDTHEDADKGHGRVEVRTIQVSTTIDWLEGERRFPGENRFAQASLIARVTCEVHAKGKTSQQTRYYICSRAMTAAELSVAVRAHWQIENALHWVLDVTFKEDMARSRTGHGPRNMATIRHFSLNLVRSVQDKRSIKLRRKRAHRNTSYLADILGFTR
jgi:predicted transposase YbfD/YdcC